MFLQPRPLAHKINASAEKAFLEGDKSLLRTTTSRSLPEDSFAIMSVYCSLVLMYRKAIISMGLIGT